ncbi:MAG: bifunctional diaminohydroxyphosphoribosylaminopyrimidine deaminase/5-amino-6-(5-phosphoribosylamino)uracil reductase RibD [Kiritimatiellaceae bacterium]|nr:bifunctional diaminohydroxyphosphoribosylaminopyrimidine deaminase/5-amino-6-(5-phosphoribosylamino)uracil reductase RibD [Kiritimatiellaceae bacterium]
MSPHEPFMQRALALARRGEGLTRPNPPVGAVLVQEGKIITEGFHKKAGGPHAEVNCLQSAVRNLKSSVLYVTLEPCSTQGRTPPCTDLILARGIRRVVIGAKDPNPVHAGRGIRILRRAGVEVITGVCRAEAEALIAPFAKLILTGMPYVTLKLASTLDGRIADASGKSKWITGPQARAKVQELRRTADAIMVGAGTVRADDPLLLPRPAKGRAPWRVIVGSTLQANAKVLTDEAAERTLVMNGSLAKILRDLGKRGVMHVLCEGGGELAGSLVRAGLVDEFAFFIAPSLLGGDGIPMIGKKGWPLEKMPLLHFQALEKCGKDAFIRALPVREK